MINNTYWNSLGKYQSEIDKLGELIPSDGSVKSPTKNKALEKLRKARNLYYDLYNNGLNRRSSFKKMFGIDPDNYSYRGGSIFLKEFYPKVEDKMDEIVLEAAKEQNIN